MLHFSTIGVIISLRGGESMTKVGELIQKGREENNLSMRQLAELAHVSHSDISRIESGEREVPNPKILRKISKYIGVNYNDLMYASGLGAQISPLNPYIIEHYRKLKGDDLKNAINSIRSNTNNNNILIESLEKNIEETSDEEKKQVLSDTIEDLKYQNETNNHILDLLKDKAAEEFLNER